MARTIGHKLAPPPIRPTLGEALGWWAWRPADIWKITGANLGRAAPSEGGGVGQEGVLAACLWKIDFQTSDEPSQRCELDLKPELELGDL